MRTVEVCSSFPADCGTLLCPRDEWANEVTHDVANAASTTATALSQTIRIGRNVDNYRHVNIWMGVYLEDPIHGNTQEGEAEVGRNLIQQVNLRIQISSLYNYNPQSSFLLVTSSESTRSRVQAIQNFINDNLEKQLDVWNICLYGGFEQLVDAGEGFSMNVLSRYHGKSIIFLGDSFKFVGAGQKVDIAELCDPRILAKGSAQDTSYLFLGSSGRPALQKLLERVVFSMPYSTADLSKSLPDSNMFDSKEDLIESVKQNKFVSDTGIHVYTVQIEKRWYRGSPHSEAAKLTRYLRQQFPQERFLVAPVAEGISSSGASPGNDLQDNTSRKSHSRSKLAILHGCPISAIATEPRTATSHHLDSFEKFMLIRALPASKRNDILWTSPATGPVHAEDEYSTSAFEYIYLSLLTDINLEIQAFLHKSRWPNRIKSPQDAQGMNHFLRLHLPILFNLLQHPSAVNQSTPPEAVLTLLQHAEAACLPQKKRHILLPVLHRRIHLRHILRSKISSFLAHKSYDKKAISTFYATPKSLHSNLHSKKRHTGKVILRQISEATRKSTHQYEKGHQTASTVVPRSMYCSEQEWQNRWQEVADARARVREETKRAMGQLGKMILDVEEEEQVEMPG